MSAGTHNRPWLIALGTLAGIAFLLFFHANKPVGVREELATLPSRIGEWMEISSDIRGTFFTLQGADTELFRTYQNPRGDTIQLYVGYLAAQTQGRAAASYLTAPFHDGAREVAIAMDPDRAIVVNERSASNAKGVQRQIFWYVADGRVIADRYQAKLATVLSALLRGRTNGGIVLIAMDTGTTNERSADQESAAFVRDVARLLQRYFP